MATRKRARTAGGQLAADNPATPDINEAWEDGKTKAQIDAEKAAGAEVVEEDVSEVIEAPAAAEVPSAEPLAELLADKRKDPEKQEQDPGLKPMTEERLAEIRATAVTPAAIEKSAIDEIIADAGVEKTRGREIAARLMFNARQRGGFV
jgi:hypothetical protein